MSASVLPVALAAHAAGLCVVPPKQDGTKAPLGTWKQYQTTRPTEKTVRGWYRNGRTGLGLICGAISGNLEMFELEGRAIDEGLLDPFLTACEEAGVGEAINRVVLGYAEDTPSGGLHLLWRCDEIAGNEKLARRPATEAELAADPDDKVKVLIETRGEGGFTIVAPSHGKVHETGAGWELVNGGFDTIATISPAERAAILDAARTLDQMPAPSTPVAAPARQRTDDRESPIERFDRLHTGREILERNGFTASHEDAKGSHYTRPGKDTRNGSSATVWKDDGTTTLFSSSIDAPDEYLGNRKLRPSQLAAALEHGGDHEAFARAHPTGHHDDLSWVTETPSPRSTTGEPDEWEPPIPLGPPPPPPFPVSTLPTWLSDFVGAVAEATQTPPDLSASLVLAALATAAGGRAVVEVRPGWREPTNLFTAVAMPPGARKTPVFNVVAAPLMAAEHEATEAARPLVIEALTRRKAAEQAAEVAQKIAGNASDTDSPQAITEATNARLMAEAITVPVMPRLLADDATPEALTSLLAEQGGRLSVLSDEGDIFEVMAGRYSKNNAPNLAVYLKGHAGSVLRVDRKGRQPEYIAAPALTLGLAVQPDVLRSISDRPGFRGRGLLARFLWSLPPSNVGTRKVGATPVPTAVSDQYNDRLTALVTTLAEWTDPAVLTLTTEANDVLLAFERVIEPRLAAGGDLHPLADWASKLAGACARLAGLLHLAANVEDGWSKPVQADTVTNAVMIAEYYIAHAHVVFDLMGTDDTLSRARELTHWLRGRQSFTRREAHRAHPAKFPKVADLDPVLDTLEALGWVRRLPQPEATTTGGRRPSPTYEVNPNVL